MLTRCTPAAVPMTDLSAHVDRLLNEVFAGFTPETSTVFSPAKPFPALNLWHDEAAIYIEAELPGFTMDDIDISLIEKEITLTATRRIEIEETPKMKGFEFIRRERAEGTFSRSVRLPVPVDPEKVTAKLVHGVLTVILPKAPEALPRRIAVKTEKGVV